MPVNEGLEIVVGADVSDAIAGLTKFENKLKGLATGSIVQLKEASKLLKAQLSSLSPEALRSDFGKQLSGALATVNAEMKTLEKQAAVTGNATSGAFNKAFQGVRQLANILPGVGIAGLLGLASSALIDLAEQFFKTGQAAANTSDILKEGGKDYEKASSLVSQLKTNIGLAKDGLISKDAVLKQYNETIGKTTGQVQTLDEAEQALNKNAEAYIRFTLLKASANIALGKAAEKAFDVEQKRRKEAERFLELGDKIVGISQRSAGAAPGGFIPTGNTLEKEKQFLDAQAKLRKEASIKRSQDEQKNLETIASDFQKQAADIAKKFKFDFFGELDPTKGKQTQDNIIARAKAFIKEFGNVFIVPDLTESFTNTKDKILAAAKKLLDDVSKGNLQLKLIPEIKLDAKVELDTSVADKLKKSIGNLFEGIDVKGGIKQKIIDGIVPGVTEGVNEANKKIGQNSQKIADSLRNIFVDSFSKLGEDIGTAIASGGGFDNLFKALFIIIGDGISALGKQMIALSPVIAALKSALKSLNPAVLLPAGIALVAIGTALRTTVSKGIKGFAEGGVVSAPTLAMIGEGAGTRNSNPEVVAPLNKLKDILSNTGGGGLPARIEVFAHGRELRGALDLTDRQFSRSF